MAGTQRYLGKLAALLTRDRPAYDYELETTDTAQHFGGVAARGADLAALEQAKKQAESGTPMREVWQKYGWYQAPWDRKWRTWLDHADTDFSEPTMVLGLQTLKPNSRIYKNYPQIKATNAFANTLPYDESVSGYYEPTTNTLSVSAPTQEAANSIGYHELQHLIQWLEGFSPGTSTDNPLIKKAVQAYKARYPKEYGKLKNIPRIAERLTATGRTLDDYLQHQLYMANAGEAESRLAQAWKGKSKDEVKKLYPLEEIPADIGNGTDLSTMPKLSPDMLWIEPDKVKLSDMYKLDKLSDLLLGRSANTDELVEILQRIGKQKAVAY
jgi:hypothetical protein